MFVQVIQGQVSDPAAVRQHLEAWRADVAPGAEGWLGTTSGVTEDGRLVALVRFESEEAAQSNSDRPEQGAWWEGMAALFDGEPEFHNSSDVRVDTHGDPGTAGFVQVMQGRTSDPQRAWELMETDDIDWQALRPDVVGSLSLGHDGDQWTMATYFTSEAEARQGEQKQPPPEVAEMMEELNSLSVGEMTFYDLTDPWLEGPSA